MANGDIRLQSPLPYFRAHGTVREPYDDVGRFQERIMGLSSPSVCTYARVCVWKKRRLRSDSSVFHVYKRTCASPGTFRTKAPTLNKNNPL